VLAEIYLPSEDAFLEAYTQHRRPPVEQAISLVRAAVEKDLPPAAHPSVSLLPAALGGGVPGCPTLAEALPADRKFDFIYVPYLLGVENGVTDPAAIRRSLEELSGRLAPGGAILVVPSGIFAVEAEFEAMVPPQLELVREVGLGMDIRHGLFQRRA
jgi:hypothetical protein